MKERKQWATDISLSRQEELAFDSCDMHGKARIASFLNYFAAIAGYDYDERGLTYKKLYSIDQVFLLSRIALRIHRYPVVNDIVTVTTWENGLEGAHVCRNFEVVDQNGEKCASAKSDWILVNPSTRRIIHAKKFTAKKINICPKEIDCQPTEKIRFPKQGIEKLTERKIVYSDLDCNGHVYSANYGDIVWDSLPEELQGKKLKEFGINYNREAKLGQKLTILGAEENGAYIVCGMNGEEQSFTAKLLFEQDCPGMGLK